MIHSFNNKFLKETFNNISCLKLIRLKQLIFDVIFHTFMGRTMINIIVNIYGKHFYICIILNCFYKY